MKLERASSMYDNLAADRKVHPWHRMTKISYWSDLEQRRCSMVKQMEKLLSVLPGKDIG